MELSSELRQFLLRFIDSIPQLEALLLMRREIDRSWDADSLASRLYIEVPAAGQVLDDLVRRGLVIVDQTRYRYSPVRDDIRRAVDDLAAVHARLLIPITELVHSKAPASVQGFADAFRLRPGDK